MSPPPPEGQDLTSPPGRQQQKPSSALCQPHPGRHVQGCSLVPVHLLKPMERRAAPPLDLPDRPAPPQHGLSLQSRRLAPFPPALLWLLPPEAPPGSRSQGNTRPLKSPGPSGRSLLHEVTDPHTQAGPRQTRGRDPSRDILCADRGRARARGLVGSLARSPLSRGRGWEEVSASLSERPAHTPSAGASPELVVGAESQATGITDSEGYGGGAAPQIHHPPQATP